MGLRDLVITPIYIVLFSAIAYFLRPYFTNSRTRKYFLPALWIRFAGAITLGLVYQFYYGGGDTFVYWKYGSQYIYQAFQDDFWIGLKLLLDSGGEYTSGKEYEYSSQIWYYRDVKSYTIVRLTAFFDLLTLHTYSSTSLFFAVFSFSGIWVLFSALIKKYPATRTKYISAVILFTPSVIFWGSGILKDTITLSLLCWLIWALIHIIDLKFRIQYLIVILISCIGIIQIKSYIIAAILPALFIWMYFRYASIMSGIVRIAVAPFLLVSIFFVGFIAFEGFSTINDEYTLDNVAKRAAITAYDIRYGWGARHGGDGGYDIGLPDGTMKGMVKLMPAAINVSLFRPYFWEVKNPLMLLSAFESFIILFLTLRFVWKGYYKKITSDPFLIFCLSFSLLFAFAVGVSTFNFGTLTRYRIPMLPLLLTILIIGLNTRSKEIYQ